MKKTSLPILADMIVPGLLAIMLIYASLHYAPAVTQLISRPEDFKQFILAYGSKSILIFMIIQALQVIVAAVPGELVQVAGGYIYGIWLGSLYSLIGIVCGSIIVFYISRILGYPVLKRLISPSRSEQFSFFLHTHRAEIITFVLFLIPGIPKDILTYLGGLTPVQPARFIIIAAAARLPGIFISSYIGASIGANQYVKVGIVSLAAVLLFLLGFVYQDKIIARLKAKF